MAVWLRIIKPVFKPEMCIPLIAQNPMIIIGIQQKKFVMTISAICLPIRNSLDFFITTLLAVLDDLLIVTYMLIYAVAISRKAIKLTVRNTATEYSHLQINTKVVTKVLQFLASHEND